MHSRAAAVIGGGVTTEAVTLWHRAVMLKKTTYAQSKNFLQFMAPKFSLPRSQQPACHWSMFCGKLIQSATTSHISLQYYYPPIYT
jgi:hypothetical protein